MQPESAAPRAVFILATAVLVNSSTVILCMVWVQDYLFAAQSACARGSSRAVWMSIADQSSVGDGSNEVARVGCSSLGLANMCVVVVLGCQRSRYCAAVQFLNRQHREERWKLASSSAPLLASCGKAVVVLW